MSREWIGNIRLQAAAAPDLGNEPLPWMDSAACTGQPAETFFPEGKGASAKDAKQVCRSCDVRAQCLAFALANKEQYGVWGGRSVNERDDILRRRRGAA